MANVSNTILTRVYILFACLLMFAVMVAFRIVGLQWNQAKWLQKEIDEKVYFKKVVADRGSIFADDGTILATSIPFYRVAMDVTQIDTALIPKYRDSLLVLAHKLADKFGPLTRMDSIQVDSFTMSLRGRDTVVTRETIINTDSLAFQGYYDRMMKAIAEKDRHIYLVRRMIDFKELEEVKTYPVVNLGRLKGGFVIEKIHNKRFYPFGELASITLGRLQGDTLGVRGIESAFNKQMRGRDGYILAQKVAGGSYLPLDQYGEEESLDGYDVHTTLNINIQEVAENALKQSVERNKAKFGTAIVIETTTGKIKALANYPETYNYAFARQVEPGSTFKLASALAMLEDNNIDVCDTIDTGNGSIMYEDKKITDAYKLGKIPFEMVFAKSSNVGTSKAIFDRYRNDPTRYIKHLEKFHLTETANTQFDGEPVPTLVRPGDELWNPVVLPSMSIGYSISLTPMQVAAFYNAVANGGKYVRPWIVESLRDRALPIRRYTTEVLPQPICSKRSADAARELLRGVVEHGTAAGLDKGLPFKIAGKTGTARKAFNGEYRTIYQSSFAGFFPAENPKYTIYVLIDEPSAGQIYGAAVAAPVFRAIAEQIYAMDWELSKTAKKADERPDPRPAPRTLYAQDAKVIYETLNIGTAGIPDADWVKPAYNGHQINYTPICPEDSRTVPDVRGMSSRDAVTLLENVGARVTLFGHGRVSMQSLQAGYRVGDGGVNITLYLD